MACTSCGLGGVTGTCSMCYGDPDHNTDGEYRAWLEHAAQENQQEIEARNLTYMRQFDIMLAEMLGWTQVAPMSDEGGLDYYGWTREYYLRVPNFRENLTETALVCVEKGWQLVVTKLNVTIVGNNLVPQEKVVGNHIATAGALALYKALKAEQA